MSFTENNKIYNKILIIPGAAKSGTSSLHEYLGEHPNIIGCDPKEPHYFSNDDYFNNGFVRNKVPYFKMFQDNINTKYYLDSSTSYLISDDALERIFSINPNAKFIFVLRNPIDRIISHYKWSIGIKKENRPFKTAIKDSKPGPFNFKDKVDKNYKYYIEFSLYYKWVSKFISRFSMDNVHIITTEELKQNPNLVVNECFEFLGLPSQFIEEPIHSNVTKKDLVIYPFRPKFMLFNKFLPSRIKNKMKRKFFSQKIHGIKKSERLWLKSLLQEDVKNLKKLLNRNFDEWKDFK